MIRLFSSLMPIILASSFSVSSKPIENGDLRVYVSFSQEYKAGEGFIDIINDSLGNPQRIDIEKCDSYIDSIPIIFPQLTELVISNYSNNIIPSAIFKMSKLRALRIHSSQILQLSNDTLQSNSIVELEITRCYNFNPNTLFKNCNLWDSLVFLKLYQDSIKEISPLITNLKNLKYVEFDENLITNFPDELFNMPLIKWISLQKNPIRNFDFLKYRYPGSRLLIFYDQPRNQGLMKKKRS